MHIAMIGTRGVPAAYGGFETAVEEIGTRLAAAGHSITVYCRGRQTRTQQYNGIRTVDLPAVRHRTAETLSHTLLSIIHTVLIEKPDAAIVFNAANSPLLPLLKAAGIPVALHTDGLEWKRGKWGATGRRYYLLAEALGVCFADQLISDADEIAKYYSYRYRKESAVITYGAPVIYPKADRLSELDLEPGRYHLVVARIEPENHVDIALRGMLQSTTTYPLVVVGSVPYPTEHLREIERLTAESSGRIRMLGSLWDQDLLDSLYSHAAVYLHGHSVGGTNPSLLRAMGAGSPIAAYDVQFNREVLGTAAEVYWRNPRDIANILDDVERNRELWQTRGEEARSRVQKNYRWDDVANLYEQLSETLLAHSRGSMRNRMKLPGRYSPDAAYVSTPSHMDRESQTIEQQDNALPNSAVPAS